MKISINATGFKIAKTTIATQSGPRPAWSLLFAELSDVVEVVVPESAFEQFRQTVLADDPEKASKDGAQAAAARSILLNGRVPPPGG